MEVSRTTIDKKIEIMQIMHSMSKVGRKDDINRKYCYDRSTKSFLFHLLPILENTQYENKKIKICAP